MDMSILFHVVKTFGMVNPLSNVFTEVKYRKQDKGMTFIWEKNFNNGWKVNITTGLLRVYRNWLCRRKMRSLARRLYVYLPLRSPSLKHLKVFPVEVTKCRSSSHGSSSTTKCFEILYFELAIIYDDSVHFSVSS